MVGRGAGRRAPHQCFTEASYPIGGELPGCPSPLCRPRPIRFGLRSRATELQHALEAAKKADVELVRHHHTMRLENQAMDKRDLAAERERLVSDMLAGSLRRVWDEE